MTRITLSIALALTALAAPATACLPPPPGMPEPPPPTEAQRAAAALNEARSIFSQSTNIVYGVITAETANGYRFKIIHAYKGTLRPGRVVLAKHGGWGYDPPFCSGMIPPPPLMPGMYGVAVWGAEPELVFLDDKRFALMADAGWIKRARP